VSLELLNALATVTTTVVIAATAIAAIVQLRHLRASNQIAGQLALRQVLIDERFMDAMGRVRFEVPELLRDPEFLEFVRVYHLADATGLDERFDGPYEAALMVARNLNNIGNMVRNGLTDRRIFLEQYAALVIMAWDAIEPLIKIRRSATCSDTPWEDFEYLAVLSRKWKPESTSCYPKGMERILPSVRDMRTPLDDRERSVDV